METVLLQHISQLFLDIHQHDDIFGQICWTTFFINYQLLSYLIIPSLIKKPHDISV